MPSLSSSAVADVLRLPARDVPQQDHLLLAWRQRGDRVLDQLERLAGQQALLRPRQCAAGPPAARASGVVRAEEAGRVDRRLVFADSEGGERNAAPLAFPTGRARLATIRRIQVFRDERPSKRSKPGEHAEPRLLHDLLRDRAARDVAERDPQHQRAVAVDERHERGLVPHPQARKEVRVGVDDQVAHDRDCNAARGRAVLSAPAALACSMEVGLAILLAALVGGVVFMLLERWQRSRAQPALADRPIETTAPIWRSGAPDLLVLGAALRRGGDPPLPPEPVWEPEPRREAPRLWTPPPSRTRPLGRHDRHRDEDDDGRPPGLWSGWANR